MGGLLSFELARELRRKNWQHPVSLFIGGCCAPQIPNLDLPIHKLPESKFIDVVSSYNGIPEQVLQNPKLMQMCLPALRADFELLETYFYTREEPLDSDIYAFGGQQDNKVSYEQISAWEKQTKGNFNLKMFAGDHFFLRGAENEIVNIICKNIEHQSSHKILV